MITPTTQISKIKIHDDLDKIILTAFLESMNETLLNYGKGCVSKGDEIVASLSDKSYGTQMFGVRFESVRNMCDILYDVSLKGESKGQTRYIFPIGVLTFCCTKDESVANQDEYCPTDFRILFSSYRGKVPYRNNCIHLYNPTFLDFLLYDEKFSFHENDYQGGVVKPLKTIILDKIASVDRPKWTRIFKKE